MALGPDFVKNKLDCSSVHSLQGCYMQLTYMHCIDGLASSSACLQSQLLSITGCRGLPTNPLHQAVKLTAS